MERWFQLAVVLSPEPHLGTDTMRPGLSSTMRARLSSIVLELRDRRQRGCQEWPRPWSNKAIELDGIELDSAYNTAWVNWHWHIKGLNKLRKAPKKRRVDSYIDTKKWVVVGFEWLPDKIIYYIDGVERYRHNYKPGDSRYTPSEIWLTGLGIRLTFWEVKAFRKKEPQCGSIISASANFLMQIILVIAVWNPR